MAASLAFSSSAWPQAASTIGQTGLVNMPDARVAPEGTLRFGYSFAEPYPSWWTSVTILPGLEGSLRFTRIMHVPGFPGRLDADYGDYKDKSADVKYVLFDEKERWPQLAIGGQDMGGTNLFPAYYGVASKRIGDFDLTLGYGAKRIDGVFGGVRYRPEGSRWAVVAEYDANDYSRDFGAAQSGAARIPKGPSVGLEYTWGWVTGQIAYTREQPAIMAYISIPLSRKEFIPKFEEPPVYDRVTPRPTQQQWLESDEHRRRMADALADQDFRGIRIVQVDNRIDVTLTNIRISQVSRAVGRAARTVLLLSPLGTREIRITYTVQDLPVATYGFFDVDRLEQYFAGNLPRWELAKYVSIRYAVPGESDATGEMDVMLAAFGEKQQGLRIVRDEEGDIFGLRFESALNRVRIRPTAGGYFNDPSGAFKYEAGLEAAMIHRLAPATFLSGSVDWILIENISDVTQPSNSTLAHVRTDIAEYKRATDIRLTRLLVNRFSQPAERVYARASAGLYEEMYGGVGGQVLYLGAGGRWAGDIAVDYVKQRDFDGLGFRDYDNVTAIASLNVKAPLGTTLTARVGRFLAGDEGVRMEFKRRFASGWETGVWYTVTNGDDITSPGSPGSPYHDKGIFLRMALDTMLTKDTQAQAFMSLAPWTRDVGQMVVSPGDLYTMLEQPVLNLHEHDGLTRLGDRDDDYHLGPAPRTVFNRPHARDFERVFGHSANALGDTRAWRAIGLGVGSTLLAFTADSSVDRWAQRHGTNRYVESVADFGNALPFAAFAGAGLLALAGEQRAADTGYSAVQSGAIGAAAAIAAKYAFGRLRPPIAEDNRDFKPFEGSLDDKSFPSERVTLLWATITPFAKEYEMPWLYGAALLTNFGRVADRKHWFSDTVAGSLLGYGIGTLVWNAHRQPERKASTEVMLTPSGVALRSEW
jgi:membrane-associated phospholipid phosphatase